MERVIEYLDSLRFPLTRITYQYILLTNDESERMDITEYVIPSGTLEVAYQQGVRRSFTLNLVNEKNLFFPGYNNLIWIGTKVKVIATSHCVNGDSFSTSLGIFLLYDPSIGHSDGQKIISFQCVDKFGRLNGTVGGALDGPYEIPVNTSFRKVIVDTLHLKTGGNFFDSKVPIIDPALSSYRIPYTLSFSSGDNYGSILIELANQAGADIYYDTEGYLNVILGVSEVQQALTPTLWHFEYGNNTYFGGDYSQAWSSIVNTVIVQGLIAETEVEVVETAMNNSIYSSIAVDKIGKFIYNIEDSNIYSQKLAKDRAKYELQKRNKILANINIQVEFLLHLDVDKYIKITDPFYNIDNENFIITGLSIPLTTTEAMNLCCVNSKELPYYNGIE